MTERQEQIVRCIREHVAVTGYSPTLTEIAARVGLASKSAVHYQLGRLEALGIVTRGEGDARCYRLAS